jgi:murein DD-endopeptidase MepM/ murein hydrolase activator NlpD
MEDIVRHNDIMDASKIRAGQLLLIPGAKERIDIKTLFIPESASGDFIWPVKGKVFSFFGSRDKNIINKGIDIACPKGTDVVASKAGVVSYINDAMRGYGKVIIIDHNDEFSTVYAHNSEILVQLGQKLPQGFIIGKVGSTGRAKRPYLHFEIRKKHEPLNPFYYLP